jgi:hypothetical protein
LSNVRPAINDGQWHSFGSSGNRLSGASPRVAASLVGRASGIAPGFAWRGNGWRGGWPAFGWGRGWGWGWGFGFGWPWWGGSWGLWNPWWYDPFWYAPSPAYSYYPDYSWEDDSYDTSSDPPYRDNQHAKPNAGTKQEDGGAVQNGQPQGAPDSAAPADQSGVISQSQT